MWNLDRERLGATAISITTPLSVVMDSKRDIIYWSTGSDTKGLSEALVGPKSYVIYDFDRTFGQTEARDMFSMVNDFRTGSETWAWDSSDTKKEYYSGLKKLEYDCGLEKVAMKRASEIALYYNHTRPNGNSCFTAYETGGVNGENIAAGYTSSKSVFEAWREDNEKYSGQGHRRNMLGSNFKYIGIGHAIVDGRHFWVQEFSSVPTNLTETSPDNSDQVVSIEVDPDLIHKKAISLSYSTASLDVGDSKKLPEVRESIDLGSDTYYFHNYLHSVDPVWSGYDSKIIRVNKSDNTIEAVGAGETTLIVSVDGTYAAVKVTVLDNPNVKSVVVRKYASSNDAASNKNYSTCESGSTIDVPYGQKIYIRGVSLPIDAGKTGFNSGTTCIVEKDSYFTYNEANGEISAVAVGSSYITFTSVRDNSKSARIKVNVSPVPISSISIGKDFTMSISSQKELTLSYEPSVTSEKIKVESWTSTDTSILTVEGDDKRAVLKSGEKEGRVTVSAKMGTLTASVNVDVRRFLRLDKTELTLTAKPGNTGSLSALLNTDSYKEKDLKWTSSQTSVLKVEKGTVTVQKNVDTVTKVTVKVATPDGLYSDTCTVTLNPWERAPQPMPSLRPGEVPARSKIALDASDPDARIFYAFTYQEGTPINKPSFDENGRPLEGTYSYEGPILIDKDMLICAVSVKEGCQESFPGYYRYRVVYDWGDVDTDKLKALFSDARFVPEGLWYTFRNEKGEYKAYYTSSSDISLEKEYCASAITFNDDIRVYHGTRRLWENRDYTVSYSGNVKAGKPSDKAAPTVIIKGKGNYSKTASFRFTISAKSLYDAQITSEKAVVLKAGAKLSSVKPSVVCDGIKLAAGKDYDLVYYKGSTSDSGRIESPSKEAVVAGKFYYIEITSHPGGNYRDFAGGMITVSVIDSSDKSTIPMSKVKVTIPKLAYDPAGIDVAALFKEGSAKAVYGKKLLTYGKDYVLFEVSGAGVKNECVYAPGKYNLLLCGSEKPGENGTVYSGDKTATMEVTGIPASKVKVAGLSASVEYTGRSFTIDELYKKDKTGFDRVTLYTAAKGGNNPLNYIAAGHADNEYEIAISGSGATGKLTVTFSLKGKYTGTIKKTVKVTPASIATADIVAGDATYSKAGAVPGVLVSLRGKVLREGIDYTLSFKNNTKLPKTGVTPLVVVKGIGNYSGTKSSAFKINKALITDAATLEISDKVYSASSKKANYKVVPKIVDSGKQLSFGTDIKKPDANNDYKYFYAATGQLIPKDAVVPAGTVIELRVTVTCPAGSPYVEGTFELRGRYKVIGSGMDIGKASVKVNSAKCVFDNGNEITPLAEEDIKVKLGGIVLTRSDYEIVSVTGNRFLGTAKVKIRGIRSYGGSKTFTFKVSARAMN
jgi:uncharacterized protein YkwD